MDYKPFFQSKFGTEYGLTFLKKSSNLASVAEVIRMVKKAARVVIQMTWLMIPTHNQLRCFIE